VFLRVRGRINMEVWKIGREKNEWGRGREGERGW
jgi:hypothetical protein